MEHVFALVLGALCGVGQFFLIRYSLKSLAEAGKPQLVKVSVLKLPIPLALLLGCALLNADLLPFVGGAFCLTLVITGAVNHLLTLKREDSL